MLTTYKALERMSQSGNIFFGLSYLERAGSERRNESAENKQMSKTRVPKLLCLMKMRDKVLALSFAQTLHVDTGLKLVYKNM